MEPESSLPH